MFLVLNPTICVLNFSANGSWETWVSNYYQLATEQYRTCSQIYSTFVSLIPHSAFSLSSSSHRVVV